MMGKPAYEKSLETNNTMENILTGINKEGPLKSYPHPKMPSFNRKLLIYLDKQNSNFVFTGAAILGEGM